MKFLPAIICLFFSQFAFAQCISNFPYKENFEKFRQTQTNASCDATIKGDTANGWIQDPGDNGDWRADTSGTPSVGTGPGATDSTSGNGSGRDYNPGTQNGVYLYTEASGACANAVINLLSPCFDFSATGKFYKLTFAYHMLGTGMGTLYVDVFDKGVWNNAVWSKSGNQGDQWLFAEVPLGKFNGSNIQIRLRAVMGPNFLSDMAIDDIAINEYFPPNYDAELVSSLRTVNNYPLYTARQGKDFSLLSTVKNNGVRAITGVKVVANCGNYSDTLLLDTIPAFGTKSGSFNKTIAPTDTANQRRIYFNVLLNETDTNYSNNSRDIASGLLDTTLARDGGTNTGALGFNGGTGQIGQMFHLKNKDTLTSVSFASINPTAGDSVKVKLYAFGTVPGTLMATSSSTILVAGANWYTLRFPCEQFLDTGKYFIAVEQLNTNNMALGYTTTFYTPATVYFGNGTTWTDAATSNFLVSMLLRMNFGKQFLPPIKMTTAGDTICQGENMLLRVSGANSYVWTPSNAVSNPTASQNVVSPTTTTTYTIKGTNNCNLSSVLDYTLQVKKSPAAAIIPDSTICFGKSITLFASGGNGYKWTGGPANTNYTVTPNSSTSYEAIIDSTNGCKTKLNVNITVDRPAIQKTNDTTLCEGQKLKLTATGLASYKWLSGPSTPDWEVAPTKTRSYIITGKNDRGCDAMDSVKTTVLPAPVTTKSNDTSICFGNKLTLMVNGGVTYKWLNGPTTNQWNFLPFASEHKFVEVTGANGCTKLDSIYVGVASFPIVTVGNDTAICEGQQLDLRATANESVSFKWSHGPTSQTITVSPISKTTYKVKGTNATGCFGEDSLTVSVNQLAKADFSASIVGKNATLVNKSTNNTSIFWDLGDGNTSTTASFIHTYAADGTYKIKLIVGNACGNDTLEKTVVINTAGLNSALAHQIHIYPQPVKNQLSIEFPAHLPGNWHLQLTDASGKVITQVVANIEASASYMLNTENLSSGLYLLQLQNGEKTYFYKMIK